MIPHSALRLGVDGQQLVHMELFEPAIRAAKPWMSDGSNRGRPPVAVRIRDARL